MHKILTAALLPALLVSASGAAAQDKKAGSLYLQCDGEPNNMSGGETFARLIGAVTLFGLFAPAPESPDPSKRLFGDAGVATCSQLIDGEKGEGNAVRRVPLILARAIHQIEAKNYKAALLDVEKARTEAAAGLADNPYFDRSMGLSFAKIEAESRLRMGDPQSAQAASYAPLGKMTYSFVPSVVLSDYSNYLKTFSPEAERKFAANVKVIPWMLPLYASRLDEAERFSDSAAKNEALIASVESLDPEHKGSMMYARTALAHALAGDWKQATNRADFARSNLAARKAGGVPEDNQAQTVEMLDLFEILRLAEHGDMPVARRNFAARSQWIAPSFGSVMEVTRRLRSGAGDDEMFGSLAVQPDEMWQKRYDELLAAKLQTDGDNKTLFNLIQPYAEVGDFEARSKDVWRVEKSRMMVKKADEDGRWLISQGGNIYTAIDAIMLHAALQAQARGKEGFTISVMLPGEVNGSFLPFSAGFARFLNRDEPFAEEVLFIPASDVIAELAPVIPSPDEVRKRKRRS